MIIDGNPKEFLRDDFQKYIQKPHYSLYLYSCMCGSFLHCSVLHTNDCPLRNTQYLCSSATYSDNPVHLLQITKNTIMVHHHDILPPISSAIKSSASSRLI